LKSLSALQNRLILDNEIEEESKFHEKPNQNVLGPARPRDKTLSIFYFLFLIGLRENSSCLEKEYYVGDVKRENGVDISITGLTQI
jgi:hypothetical protein